MTDLAAAALLVTGGFFCLVAGLGILRLGDVYCRMHAATKAGTLGLCLICLAAMLESRTAWQAVEALFVFLFMIATAPIGAHLIGRAAYRAGVPMLPGTRSDPEARAFLPEKRNLPSASPGTAGKSTRQAPDNI